MSDVREEHGWSVVTPSGFLLVFSVRSTRAEAIKTVLALHGPSRTWRQLRDGGYRAIRVVVRPGRATR